MKVVLLLAMVITSIMTHAQQKYELRVKQVHTFDSTVDLAGGCLVHPCWDVDGEKRQMYLGVDSKSVYVIDTMWIMPLPELYGKISREQVRTVYFYLFDNKIKSDSPKIWLEVDWKTTYMLATTKFRDKYLQQKGH